jgi:hypothetical protein
MILKVSDTSNPAFAIPNESMEPFLHGVLSAVLFRDFSPGGIPINWNMID